MTAEESRPIRIGISSCLLGQAVRFDGGHKRHEFLTDTLGSFVEWVPVCPEVECGLGTPRESMRLVRKDGGVRLLTVRSAVDLTDQMERYAQHRVSELRSEELCGYVLKKDSPSCGLLRVKLYPSADRDNAPDRVGQGLFAAALVRAFPHLPIEEEGRLNDAHLRENFIERVFAYHRLQRLWASRWTLRSLIAFHTANKMTLLSHDELGYRRLGRLVAIGKSLARAELRGRYEAGFMTTLEKLATPGRHVNVLTHMLGHFSDRLEPVARQELLGVVEDYQRGLVPLIAPLTLVRHYIRTLKVEYLLGQTYLDPHPKELMLRNRV